MSELFADVIGHEKVTELLASEFEKPGQAYLFVGPQSVGKAFVALRFAAGLLGGDSDERSRRLTLAGTHPDLTILEPEGATSLGVDQARDVVSRAAMSPIEADRSVFLFPDAGSMTDSAANALLKTLEEPASSVVFLLVAESEDDFPPTVASRCRTIHMGRVPSAGHRRSPRVEGPRSRSGNGCCGCLRWSSRPGSRSDDPARGGTVPSVVAVDPRLRSPPIPEMASGLPRWFSMSWLHWSKIRFPTTWPRTRRNERGDASRCRCS